MEMEQNINISAETIELIDYLAKKEGCSREQILTKALAQYSKTSEMWSEIFEKGEKWARDLGIKTEKDVENLIHEFRKEQASTKSSL